MEWKQDESWGRKRKIGGEWEKRTHGTREKMNRKRNKGWKEKGEKTSPTYRFEPKGWNKQRRMPNHFRVLFQHGLLCWLDVHRERERERLIQGGTAWATGHLLFFFGFISYSSSLLLQIQLIRIRFSVIIFPYLQWLCPFFRLLSLPLL